MSNMPFEDSVFFLPLYQSAKAGEDYKPEDDDRRWYKKQLDKAHECMHFLIEMICWQIFKTYGKFSLQ